MAGSKEAQLHNEPPFDARRAHLTEAVLPPARRSTVALVTAVRHALLARLDSDTPAGEEAIHVALGELTDRGIDGDSLVRYGFLPELVAVLALRLVLGVQPPESERIERWREYLADVRELDDLLKAGEPPVGNLLKLAPLFSHLVSWVRSAPLDHLVNFEPFAETKICEPQEFQADLPIMQAYRWIVDRFSVTSPSEWSVDSLVSEYRWRHSITELPCPADLMNEPSISDIQLDRELARRRASPTDGLPEELVPGLNSSLSIRMQQQAVLMLSQGSYEGASALFRFALSQDPNDVTAMNNLGFCLIPTSPKEALDYLRRAAAMGYDRVLINAANRALCHLLLGELDSCLEIAEKCWDQAPPERAYLWVYNGTHLELGQGANAKAELARLAEIAARRSGFDERADQWRRRAAA